ncbi:ADP-ribose pyrophosphatase YjhB, NUDIX family [Clostridium cavendishii DSM 21758]|uniref:ADP-ribose pyrophosphatase YjhB, NUDIX family n=1 Tax=Clostridium cavendishii DSM 21758 TaxID=1121302 RepID=A0A1M6D8R5_9CLOT|nr:NUDIX hydrolase [Clostridium cavendishii]SHI69593.1 ADP-ribose pyrophosphatase YjhB, NUDIX family [Clostridium cavendishii DSM 21758]
MGCLKAIESYKPYNKEEEKEKALSIKYIKNFNDIFERKNELIHITSSAWIINKSKDKVLMVHHNIYNSWSWVGGHADGDNDLLKVALKETREETGIENIRILSNDIFSIDILNVKAHYRRGEYVAPHLHLSIAYLFEADENEKTRIKEDENSGVKWIEIGKVMEYTKNEPHMQKLYSKFINKINKEAR